MNSFEKSSTGLRAGVALGVALMLGACSSPPREPAEVAVLVPAAFQGRATPPVAMPQSEQNFANDWWRAFGDPQLDALIEKAGTGNTSIQIAAAKLAQSRALSGQSAAATRPVVTLEAGVSRQQGPLLNAAGEEGTLLTAGAHISYEIDLLGKLARVRDAATLDAGAREDLLGHAQLIIQAQVARNYLSIRVLDEEIAQVQRALIAGRTLAEIQEARRELGSISELDLKSYTAEYGFLNLELLDLQQQRSEKLMALATLLGTPVAEFSLPEPVVELPLLQPQPGIPASVLGRRPDVAAALKNVQAASQRLGAAQSNWLPGLSLTGAAGYASPELRNLFTASMQTLVVGALAQLPLFDGGRRDAAIAQAEADFRLASAQYQDLLLQALREVEEQLSTSGNLTRQQASVQWTLSRLDRAAELSASRFQSGLISRKEMLESQSVALRARRKALQIKAARFQSSVDLVRALGGAGAAYFKIPA